MTLSEINKKCAICSTRASAKIHTVYATACPLRTIISNSLARDWEKQKTTTFQMWNNQPASEPVIKVFRETIKPRTKNVKTTTKKKTKERRTHPRGQVSNSANELIFQPPNTCVLPPPGGQCYPKVQVSHEPTHLKTHNYASKSAAKTAEHWYTKCLPVTSSSVSRS